MTGTIAYHFVGDTLRDGRPVPEDNVKLVHEGPVEICSSGLHASLSAFDALLYAPGPTLCKVLCSDVIDSHDDKFVCRERTILQRFDATELMSSFARECALSVVHLWDAPETVIKYLKTGDPELRSAAKSATYSAAYSAARYAAESAARYAAWSARYAARFESGSATEKAAKSAALYAAWSAAWSAKSAARLKQKTRFDSLVEKKFKE